MNLGIVTKPNAKGQVVIPKKFRDELGIDKEVLLSLTLKGRGIYITPLERTLASKDSRSLFLEVLKKTAGSWTGDNWLKTEKRRKKIELAASGKRKNAWEF